MKAFVPFLVVGFCLNVYAVDSFSPFDEIMNKGPYSELMARSYPLSYFELTQLAKSKITAENLDLISLLINGLNMDDPEARENKLVKEILIKNGLTSHAALVDSVLLKKAIESDEVLKILGELYKNTDKIQGFKLKQIMRKAIELTLNMKIDKFDEALSPNGKRENSQNGYNGIVYGYGYGSQQEEIDYMNFLELIGEEGALEANKILEERRSQAMQNNDLILPSKFMQKGQIKETYLTGKYSIRTTCGGETHPLNRLLEITHGRTYNCDPGHFSKNGHALVSPYFKTVRDGLTEEQRKILPPRIVTYLSYEMSATGGYACERWMGRPKDCRDYTSTASGDFKGTMIVEACTDIYAPCDLVFNVTRDSTTDKQLSLTLDGRAVENTNLLRDEDHEVSFSASDSVSHSSGSGKKKLRRDFQFTLSKGSNWFIPTFRFTPAEPLTVQVLLKNIKTDIYKINDLANRIFVFKEASKTTPWFAQLELSSLYTVLEYIGKHKDKYSDPMTQRALHIIHQNVSNRVREIRETALRNEIERNVDLYRNRYGSQNLYLNLLESFIRDEERLERAMAEYEQIIETLLADHVNGQQVNFEMKKAILKSLYSAEVQEKNHLVANIKKGLIELAQYQDLRPEMLAIQQELSE